MSKTGTLELKNFSDDAGRPAGGWARATGFSIEWQNGPLGTGENRKPPNGAFVEDVLEACRERLAFYQASEFACGENEAALQSVANALAYLNDRTDRRIREGVEGTHTK